MVELSVAPIQISAFIGNTLSGLFINNQALNGFSEDVLGYQLSVATDVMKLDIQAVTESADTEVEVPETYLHPGMNEIDIAVQGSNGEQTYKLNVLRPTPTPIAVIAVFGLLIYYIVRTLKKRKKRLKYQMIQER